MLRIALPPPATAATLPNLEGASAQDPIPGPPSPATAAPEVALAPPSPTGPPMEPTAELAPPALVAEALQSALPDGSDEGGLPPDVRAYVLAHVRPEVEHEATEWVQGTRAKLRQALRGYGLDADIIGDRLTPNAALVRFKGTDRMTVAEVEKRRGVLLTSHGLDVIGVRPEKGEVIVMVARESRAILDMCESWRRRAFPATAPSHNTSFVIGERENDGRLLYLNLSSSFEGQPVHGPHTLIAGETGGGKGVLTRNLILDICATNAPTSARIRMIDPKSGGDYPWLGALPHVDGGLVSTQPEAIEMLKQLVATMEERYPMITAIAPNIDKYNAKMSPEQRLPRIYVFHDELGDWMADKDNADYRAAVESYVVRLASKARAAGIHLFLITQRPDKDALPGQIKANMNNKICLRVSSQTNSRIVLDEGGAEALLGNGHFAAKLANEKPSNQSSLVFGQAPFMDDDEAHELAQVIAAHWKG